MQKVFFDEIKTQQKTLLKLNNKGNNMKPNEFKEFLSGILFDKDNISQNESLEIMNRLKLVKEENGFVSWFSGVTEMTLPEKFSKEMILKINKKIEESNALYISQVNQLHHDNLSNQPRSNFPSTPLMKC